MNNATMFIKTTFKDSKRFKNLEADVTKIADFRWKSADVSRTQEEYHMIYVFFGSSLGKV